MNIRNFKTKGIFLKTFFVSHLSLALIVQTGWCGGDILYEIPKERRDRLEGGRLDPNRQSAAIPANGGPIQPTGRLFNNEFPRAGQTPEQQEKLQQAKNFTGGGSVSALSDTGDGMTHKVTATPKEMGNSSLRKALLEKADAVIKDYREGKATAVDALRAFEIRARANPSENLFNMPLTVKFNPTTGDVNFDDLNVSNQETKPVTRVETLTTHQGGHVKRDQSGSPLTRESRKTSHEFTGGIHLIAGAATSLYHGVQPHNMKGREALALKLLGRDGGGEKSSIGHGVVVQIPSQASSEVVEPDSSGADDPSPEALHSPAPEVVSPSVVTLVHHAPVVNAAPVKHDADKTKTAVIPAEFTKVGLTPENFTPQSGQKMNNVAVTRMAATINSLFVSGVKPETVKEAVQRFGVSGPSQLLKSVQYIESRCWKKTVIGGELKKAFEAPSTTLANILDTETNLRSNVVNLRAVFNWSSDTSMILNRIKNGW